MVCACSRAISDALRGQLEEPSAADQYTGFAEPPRLVADYVSQQSGAFTVSYEVSVILLTGGTPEPVPHKYAGNAKEENRREALELARELAQMGLTLHTIGLGR